MGFNGLFTRLHADFSDMLTALAAVNLPDQWRKVDRVREARALQVRRRRGGKRGGRGRRVLRVRRGRRGEGVAGETAEGRKEGREGAKGTAYEERGGEGDSRWSGRGGGRAWERPGHCGWVQRREVWVGDARCRRITPLMDR